MTTLTTVTACQVLSFATEGSATFTWNESDPLAVNMTISLPYNTEDVTVQFSRELLDQALSSARPVGLGDVIIQQLFPGDPHLPLRGMARDLSRQDMAVLRFLLARDGGSHVGLLVPVYPLIDFVARSFIHTPAKYEDAGVDGAIEKILAGGAS